MENLTRQTFSHLTQAPTLEVKCDRGYSSIYPDFTAKIHDECQVVLIIAQNTERLFMAVPSPSGSFYERLL